MLARFPGRTRLSRALARKTRAIRTHRRYLRQYVRLCREHSRDIAVADVIAHYRPWVRSIVGGRTPLLDETPWIGFAALGRLDRIARPGVTVFEFGTGGSTLYFLKRGCRVSSVEHDPDWYDAVSKAVAAHGYSGWRGWLRGPDRPGRAEETGVPGGYRSAYDGYADCTFSGYATTIDQFADGSLDLVLIDGRARVSCFAHAFSKVKPGGTLVLDDSERDRYRPVHDAMARMRWKKRDFLGPGPYATHQFTATAFWQRPPAEETPKVTSGEG